MKQFFAQLHTRNLPWYMAWLVLPEWVYKTAVVMRNNTYVTDASKIVTVSVPVVSVGNLTTGGTGKTPIVIALAKECIQQGLRVVVLSRGYGAKDAQDYARATSPSYGDEAFLIQQEVPEAVVIVGSNRSGNAKQAIKEYQPDVIILDDGFQHQKLGRDVNVLLMDAQAPIGNGHLLPAGSLREPYSELKRASVILVTRAKSGESIQRIEALAEGKAVLPVPFVYNQITKVMPQGESLDEAGLVIDTKTINTYQKIIALSGIANPAQFKKALLDTSVRVDGEKYLADHHEWTVADIEALPNWKGKRAVEQTVYVTTKKDWVKIEPILASMNNPDLYTRFYLLELTPLLDTTWFYNEFLKPLFANRNLKEIQNSQAPQTSQGDVSD